MEVKVNGFKYSALYSGFIDWPTLVAINLFLAIRSSIRNFTFPEDNYERAIACASVLIGAFAFKIYIASSSVTEVLYFL
ncbi:MAG: hypothetical protein MSA89_02715 [Clostridium sp.]|nr:hypothetical protein [Clostridium sp.]